MNNDITFCINENCPVRHKCRRGQEPAKEIVSIAMFEYDGDTHDDLLVCDGWWGLNEVSI